ncbi:hypothetical protein Pyn_40260 [Prunus yedoensis var. nudiflora]|uniref:Phytocyanin domain-containing protein n=1 Tax=Prunus yedoensis var. nudiflora TaxID=2094558 RepID=A0A314Y4M5_PRUYE|nr:hypothetical protein Pyn_40260 [Prunus yedoensis var. nudiflora]
MSIGMSKLLVMGISLFVCLLFQCEEIYGKEYVVGDDKGWSPDTNLSSWSEGKKFKAGDALRYYEACDPYPVQKDVYTSGNDHVVLEKGANAFVPLDISYCNRGMKLQVVAE